MSLCSSLQDTCGLAENEAKSKLRWIASADHDFQESVEASSKAIEKAVEEARRQRIALEDADALFQRVAERDPKKILGSPTPVWGKEGNSCPD
eukprot:12880786-Prorocentrum_lima.AAC.1